MSKKYTILGSIALITMLVTVSLGSLPQNASGGTVAASAAALPAAPEPDDTVVDARAPDAAPDRLTAGQNPGMYMLEWGEWDPPLDPAEYPVAGSMRFFGWSGLQNGPGSYNWGELDSWIARR